MESTLTQAEPFCIVKNLQVLFHGRNVLQGIDLTLSGNGIVVVLGSSGSGKTTFLRSLNRLNECYPGYSSSGRVNLKLSGTMSDINHSDLPLTELRRQVGMVFQTPNVLPTSIAQNISLPLKLVTGLGKSEREARLVEVLQEVHLWDEVKNRLKDNAFRLSGGQQQRLCMARVLALKPQVLLLDEPTASLDFKTSHKIEDLLIELQEHYQIIAVSHSLRQARKIADQILIMKEGRIEHLLKKEKFEDPKILQKLLEEIF
ncbi:MAG: ATP-binding cassette domain-containing protein [Deltaproteobacteria bacterium]|nr:ATP-binding cassette domain-containing protein [Deltaproteobacteria bacterium]MCW9048905.1 ATP-binding cassette domain-containing protein [Deltaproteobacteria bacterium]